MVGALGMEKFGNEIEKGTEGGSVRSRMMEMGGSNDGLDWIQNDGND